MKHYSFKEKFCLKVKIFLSLFLLTPSFVFAADSRSFADIVKNLVDISQTAVVLVSSLAVLYFFWGLSRYMFSSGDEAKIKESKSIMIWGVIGLFALFSWWGLVTLLKGAFLEGQGSENQGTNFRSGVIYDYESYKDDYR